jgi:hypothetical protein
VRGADRYVKQQPMALYMLVVRQDCPLAVAAARSRQCGFQMKVFMAAADAHP